ncbi:MAG: hypothetical protein LCH41_13760 [Armatimonadetes bacterium]|nr:hypothetical protein [Armatimonadota bacterium]
MILVLSTSSPRTSLAWFEGETCVWSGDREAPRAASSAICALLEESQIPLDRASQIMVDVGPGSFTGVRVGVTMAKVWAAFGPIPVAEVHSFDLISPDAPVAVYAKRGRSFLRIPGESPQAIEDAMIPGDALGYGTHFADAAQFPVAARWGPGLPSQKSVEALNLVPCYVAEPDISVPKQQLIMGEAFAHDPVR